MRIGESRSEALKRMSERVDAPELSAFTRAIVQADQLQVPVARSAIHETTALGAAYLAGLVEGVWSSTDEVAALWQVDLRCEPQDDPGQGDARHARWRSAVERSRGWATAPDT